MKPSSIALIALASIGSSTAHAVEIYGGAGTTGAEIGISQSISSAFSARLDYNTFEINRSFTTNDIHYDAKLKASNAGAYIDYFILGGFRLTGGALIGNRNIHGTARGNGSSITLNGVIYPTTASDTLDFEAKFPNVTPYLGLGYGHNADAHGFGLYADLGVAYGRPKVQLSPSASLAAKVSQSDLAAEQSSAQDQANSFRFYPALKLGVRYQF